MSEAHQALCIAMVGLPARGKSTLAQKIQDGLAADGVRAAIFNNGEMRRALDRNDTTAPDFYHPANTEAAGVREKIAALNIQRAREFLRDGGQVAILDATNVSRKRREFVERQMHDIPLLFLECFNEDEEILEENILQKARLSEFAHLETRQATASFKKRIEYYRRLFCPLGEERNFIRQDSFLNTIHAIQILDRIPYFEQLRDLLVTDFVPNLYVARHGTSVFNLENRVGGDSPLAQAGHQQAKRLAATFRDTPLSMVFTSTRRRTRQTAAYVLEAQQTAPPLYSMELFDEIDCGICEEMDYEEVKRRRPDVHRGRVEDKYNFVYPGGEGYRNMRARIERGVRKALYLSGGSRHILIIGHRAVNRLILSYFLYRRPADVPYLYIPQDRYFHISCAQNERRIRLRPLLS
ncbi:histidine phosphatase family protein [Desulfohalobium retbaense]|uniref:Phosphoglycerate mutase n=1 Tax=Desulfohalobium retbaense (strain ATCC 49708 / DSM 5692 / JCM 16813 / HR100) TaxID=485915 RepID=C8WZN1_DESRD|nr:6-phosphofructo-2-kinase/fructose-2,6-bisphosphatase [Desulfohalobium retbaense]ACV67506.1 Phosphoglycerate mutase [Desulfohalobium retbaense DSM 5692]